ncbi:hypothetical protein [Olleya aquimaris]|uniref:T9SS C-terminal target domain-containing protein n=1 Tax=Olleya aquimaris TaxID=639310 RepID=A0A327RIQ1_9FLAO|nr:hypothetical protein [Olleya aquimaris]RAJ16946.1 hypothetical protein LY08_00723 [Olleya aquimaris]
MKKITLLLLTLIFCNPIFATNTNNNSAAVNSVQIIRLDYTSPNGAIRELVLGFTSDNAASDGVDYGYDATVSQPFANDLNWLIEGNRYVIQGVGAFDNTKQYLFGLFNEVAGTATIELTSLENFNTDIEVFIYDALLDTYTKINDTAYTETINAEDYLDRFYIAFSQPASDNNDTSDNTDTTDDTDTSDTTDSSDTTDNSSDSDDTTNDTNTEVTNKKVKVKYIKGLNQLKIKSHKKNKILEIHTYDYNGSLIQSLSNINSEEATINLTTENTNLILHVVTENETFVKQIVVNN